MMSKQLKSNRDNKKVIRAEDLVRIATSPQTPCHVAKDILCDVIYTPSCCHQNPL